MARTSHLRSRVSIPFPATVKRVPALELRGITRSLTLREDATMPKQSANVAEIESQISAVRDNIRELVEQAAGYSGAADEELISRRIAEQEVLLDKLKKQRDSLLQQE